MYKVQYIPAHAVNSLAELIARLAIEEAQQQKKDPADDQKSGVNDIDADSTISRLRQ